MTIVLKEFLSPPYLAGVTVVYNESLKQICEASMTVLCLPQTWSLWSTQYQE